MRKKKHHHRYDRSRRRAKGKGRETREGPPLDRDAIADIRRAIGRDGAEARTRSDAESIRLGGGAIHDLASLPSPVAPLGPNGRTAAGLAAGMLALVSEARRRRTEAASGEVSR